MTVLEMSEYLAKFRRDLRFAVLGAGNGGQALAGYLAWRGFPVRLYNRSADKLEGIRDRGGVELEGRFGGFGRLEAVTSDLGEALQGARVILVVIPASGHRDLARALAPHLAPGQVVVLNPGRTGGAFEFYRVFRERGVHPAVTVAEAQTFIFASRVVGPGRARIFEKKRRVPVAALPAGRTRTVVRLMRRALSEFVPAAHVLETSLANIGAIFHPAPALMNAARIENGSSFDHYHDGISPAVARVLEAMDEERLAVARALGLRLISAREWLRVAYGAVGPDLYTAIASCSAYAGIGAPREVNSRYLHEDVPAGLVPLAALGQLTGVTTPAISAIVDLASVAVGADFRAAGRTLERMGLDGMTVNGLWDYVLRGERAPAARSEEAHSGGGAW
ncbi:MAG: NAD/NADP octopine/nopaline dehydrogenase family protein [bacterium]|nr:NAD/NADP octopine/nopaline dehydrogenase family protein [bacterium]